MLLEVVDASLVLLELAGFPGGQLPRLQALLDALLLVDVALGHFLGRGGRRPDSAGSGRQGKHGGNGNGDLRRLVHDLILPVDLLVADLGRQNGRPGRKLTQLITGRRRTLTVSKPRVAAAPQASSSRLARETRPP